MNTARLYVLFVFGALATVSAAQETIRRGKIGAVEPDKLRVVLKADGRDIEAFATEDTRFFEAKGQDAKEKLRAFKAGADVMFVVREEDGKNFLVGLRLVPTGKDKGKDKGKGKRPMLPKVDSSKLIPLNELGAKEYNGFQGGFYPEGKNERPTAHEKAGLKLAAEVQPRDADGKPDPQGKIVLLSVGMSNTSQASQGFQRALAGARDQLNPAFVFVNGAQGGMTAARIQNPANADGAKYWSVVDQQIKKAGATNAQVQVVWIKQADAGPSQGFPAYAKKLEEELTRIVQLLPKRFPNVKLVYLTSRTYGGYATTPLNPEPYAYESAFSVKWLIERQIKGEAELNFDPKKGDVKAPWLSWGPYFWANGEKKRPDGFSYEQADFTANDGTHLTKSGMDKVGGLMLRFFQSDTTARPWFVAKAK